MKGLKQRHCMAVFLLLTAAALRAESPDVLTAATIEHPPHSFREDARITGLHVELMQVLANRLGYHLNVRLYPPARTLLVIQSAEAQIIFPIVKNPQREALLWFSAPIGCAGSTFYQRRGANLHWATWRDLAGYRIGAINGYAYGADFMKAIDAGEIHVEFAFSDDPNELNLRKLLARRIDLAVLNPDVFSWLQDTRRPAYDGIEPIDGPAISAQRSFHVGFVKQYEGSEALQQAFDRVLAEFRKTDAWPTLHARFGLRPNDCADISRYFTD